MMNDFYGMIVNEGLHCSISDVCEQFQFFEILESANYSISHDSCMLNIHVRLILIGDHAITMCSNKLPCEQNIVSYIAYLCT